MSLETTLFSGDVFLRACEKTICETLESSILYSWSYYSNVNNSIKSIFICETVLLNIYRVVLPRHCMKFDAIKYVLFGRSADSVILSPDTRHM